MTTLSGQWLFEQHAFVNNLPIPITLDTSQRKVVTLQVQQTRQFMGVYDAQGQPLPTTVWGVGTGTQVSSPGPTLLAFGDQALTVNWRNKLPIKGHLHGGHTQSIYDGLPGQWFTQNPASPGATGPKAVGPDFKTSSFVYDNDQQAATLWYHDHALGMTRLNVYAGLAGFYILKDAQRLAKSRRVAQRRLRPGRGHPGQGLHHRRAALLPRLQERHPARPVP